MKKIYFYQISPRIHSSNKLMINHPPIDYQFLLSEKKTKTNFLKIIYNSKLIKFFYKKLIRKIIKVTDVYQKFDINKAPKNIDLIYSSIPLDIKFPYILEILDHPVAMAGYDYQLFIKNKRNLENKLLSPFCKKIVVVNESSYKLMKQYFSEKVINKTILVRAVVKEQNFKKNYNKKNINILFIGSLANPDDFYIKGGLEALESFKKISEEFDNVFLVVKCKVPREIKRKYQNITNLNIIEKKLETKEWLGILQNSDICLNLGHVYPLMATLESLSYSIPLIMLDTWGVRDYLTNKKNALLIRPSDKIKGYNSEEYPLNIRSKEFIKEIKNIDKRVISDICDALRKLIKDPKLRERLGKEGRRISKDKFSIEKRNKELKKIFDEALNKNIINKN